ncbi:ankyrin repeat and SAM domain-containing protein 3-like isoform X2 [Prorops nasuta]|uniref:ankyrin repeat and SAM domain-containing protein 3-like isoform X2 n=1 Tax=Prorops nasuta TaxID=863751 RepID=UPI0034CD3832
MTQQNYNLMKHKFESKVLSIIRNGEYTLNTVNNYGDNILSTSVANGCFNICQEILKDKKNFVALNRKNKFGWTPLMQAVRNKDSNIFRLLLNFGSSINEYSYLGMSTLALASAISEEIFEMVYNACPSALKDTDNDDISPLCIAAMTNNKNLFFKLIDLGVTPSKSSNYTHIMMKQSKAPEIAAMAKPFFEIEDYWNDISDNINTEDESLDGNDIPKSNNCTKIPLILINNLKVLQINDDSQKKILSKNQETLTPNFDSDGQFPASPNFCFTLNSKSPQKNLFFPNNINTENLLENQRNLIDINKTPNCDKLKRIIYDKDHSTPEKIDFSSNFSFNSDFSPPCSPQKDSEEHAFGEDTPTPPHCKTPPKGIILNSNQTEMIFLLERFNLSEYIPVFLKEEVDMDIFLTLNNEDLQEIGIEQESDRKAILTTIQIYKQECGLDDNDH